MFVKNQTSTSVSLPRGEFLGGVFVAAVVSTVVYRVSRSGLERWEGARRALPEDPPVLTDRPLWEGASITAAGTVAGPGCPPHAARVSLRVGEACRSLAVFGDRSWVRNAGKLVPSMPAAWDCLPLSWRLAFGGTLDIPPGPFGPKRLPHPGGRVSHSLNPHGRGFCLDEARAEGTPLPNIEATAEPMRKPTDQPRPAGFAPCPDLLGLRLRDDEIGKEAEDPEQLARTALRFAHPAPGELIFPSLAEGTSVELAGMAAPVRFEIPRCPYRVVTRKGRSSTPISGAVRNVHASADDGAVLVTFGHAFCYEVAPSWVEVAET